MAEILRIDPDHPAGAIVEAVRVIQAGGVIIYPTETLYGLGANPRDAAAMERVYAIKGRAAARPIPFLIKDREMLEALVEEVPPLAEELMARYWPGPLTLIFRARKELPATMRGTANTIGLRISSHPVAQGICARLDTALTATSANRSGEEDLVDGKRVAAILSDWVDLIIDSGTVPGIGSTVVDLTLAPPGIVREGTIKLPHDLSPHDLSKTKKS
jgi:L-threonylcarbamoyladenylate synthase